MEDTDIIELFLNRSEEAIRQTDIKYSKLCFGIAWNILLNKEDSEECVNDTWLITWNEIPPKIPKILSAFLGKITRNQAIDCLRRKNAFKRPDSHMADINGELERLEETVQYSLEHNIKRQEILDVLDEFLKGLKEEDFVTIGDIIYNVLNNYNNDRVLDREKKRGSSLTNKYKIYN